MRISKDQAIVRLCHGEVVAIPTETVYGLAASIKHEAAIEAIFSLKGRPQNNPLIVHVARGEGEVHPMEALIPYVEYSIEGLEKLVEAFWPGPLTLVLPARKHAISSIARAGLSTAAFRMPLHSVAQEILAQTGPLVAPSANRSGSPSSTCVEHVEADFGGLFPVVDGGVCQSGVESTILIVHEGRWRVGRLGAIAPEALAPVLGYLPEWKTVQGDPLEQKICCPGQLYRHYAPLARLTLGEKEYAGDVGGVGGEAVVVGFSDREYSGARVFCLGTSSDPVGCLNRLYFVLRALDQEQISSAWVDLCIPETGLWRTLRERLIRAAGR